MKIQEVLKLKDGERVKTIIDGSTITFNVIRYSDGEVTLETDKGKNIINMCFLNDMVNLDFETESSRYYTIKELIDIYSYCDKAIYLKAKGRDWECIESVIEDIFKNEEFPLEALKENEYLVKFGGLDNDNERI